uniref:EF-hand domain-containing protein n=1 Tax=Varanus komodoensis TaxID=61221 RepID=A0A8D2J7J1_VARKO
MPHLLNSICTIIGVFHKYAKWQGDCSTLNRKEMKELILQEEFGNPHDPETVELIFQKLDFNENGLLDFNEYLLLLFQFTKACYSHLQPRECLSEGGPQEEGRDRRQVHDGERVGVRERPDSGRTRLRPIEGTTGSQEREDRRRRDSSDEQEMQDKLSSRDPERWQDRTHNHKPVDGADECFSLPRVGERRRSRTPEPERRERSWPSEPDRPDGERTGQRRGRTQYRGAEHGPDQPSGPEVREAERRLPH